MNVIKGFTAVDEILRRYDVRIGGDKPQDIIVKNDNFFGRVLAGGSLALGESYMDGWWHGNNLDHFFTNVLRGDIQKNIPKNFNTLIALMSAKTFNRQKKSRAFHIARHYDLGRVYEIMLGKTMAYSCGYWAHKPRNLDEAQETKFDLICRKVALKKGDRILDIGCGWGGFMRYAVENYNVTAIGITVSEEQVKLAQKRNADLHPQMEFRKMDYRDLPRLNEKFDHVISIGMFEHVGYKNYRKFFEMVAKMIKPGGLFLLHTIGGNESAIAADPWVDEYIFPNGMLPSIAQIGAAIEGLFVMEDWHNFSAFYDQTLMTWYEHCVCGKEEIIDKYDERFWRMWEYYLLSFAGSFRARVNQLWQVVLSPKGIMGGYRSVR